MQQPRGQHEKGKHRLRDKTELEKAQQADKDAQGIIAYAKKRTTKPMTKAQRKAQNDKDSPK